MFQFNPTLKFDPPRTDTTALVVGAGAVENSWAPVPRAIQPYYEFPLTADAANCFLARLIYLLRWWAPVETDLAKSEMIKHKDFLREIREAICRELKRAQSEKELFVRKQFRQIVKSFVVPRTSRFMFLTTNWDTVVNDALVQILNETINTNLRPLHIHGSYLKPNSLYLPTELTKEPYRTREEEQEIGGLHGSIWRGLESAQRVVVYGLSLSPLDAELGQTLACGWSNPNLKEISIISPDHQLVATRVNLLLDPRWTVVVKGYNPDDLIHATDYTVLRHEDGPGPG